MDDDMEKTDDSVFKLCSGRQERMRHSSTPVARRDFLAPGDVDYSPQLSRHRVYATSSSPTPSPVPDPKLRNHKKHSSAKEYNVNNVPGPSKFSHHRHHGNHGDGKHHHHHSKHSAKSHGADKPCGIQIVIDEHVESDSDTKIDTLEEDLNEDLITEADTRPSNDIRMDYLEVSDNKDKNAEQPEQTEDSEDVGITFTCDRNESYLKMDEDFDGSSSRASQAFLLSEIR